ncbi:MAG: 92, gp92 [Candidatus Eremiobacteraeota bacterium]|nr:92, gp92 [Candidatus Eremiobacteraeota bacterium]
MSDKPTFTEDLEAQSGHHAALDEIAETLHPSPFTDEDRQLGALLAMVAWINDEPIAKALSGLYARLTNETPERATERYATQRNAAAALDGAFQALHPSVGDVDLDAIKARADAATPGPWAYDGKRFNSAFVFDNDGQGYAVAELCKDGKLPAWMAEQVRDRDGNFIAHARTDVPTLLGLIAQLNSTLSRFRDSHGPGGVCSAPELAGLLEQRIAAVDALTKTGGSLDDGGPLDQVWANAMAHVRAAAGLP